MRIKYINLLLAMLLTICIKVQAQTDISMSTHMNNRAYYNPAFIARPDYLYLYFNTRYQWIGINGAPVVYNVQVSEYFNNIRSAIGLSLVNDKIGVTQAVNPMLTYAYRIAGKDQWSLSMGLSAGIFVRTINSSLFDPDNTNDPSLFDSYNNRVQPDVNAGFEFQNTHFVYGLSSTHLFSFSKSDSVYLNSNHRYLYAIYKNEEPRLFSYNLGVQLVNRYNYVDLEGSFSLRLKHQPQNIEGPLLKGPQEVLEFGITCRTSRQISFLGAVMISSYLRLGYAYNQSIINGIYRNQTHEIMLEYRIPAKAATATWHCGNKEFWYH
jgi:type IX secretion system PorP/SprF family membrane protein